MFERIAPLLESCPCGQKHTLSTVECVVADDAAEQMREFIERRGFRRPAILCDENTEIFADALSDITEIRLCLDGHAHATEIYSAQAIEFIRTNAPDVLIACGSGSVHDITRYAAYKEKLSFLSYPTAASVDGFISGVAAMTWYGQKLTFPAAPPLAVFAVPAVFCSAPSRLTASGAGDVLGKYTSLFDWKAAEILTGETCCSGICGLEYQAMDDLCRALKNRRPETEREYTVKVMEALLLSGLAMQLAGNSRPASGAEHHLSHLWEMHCINEESDALHGEKVGIGLLHVLREYHKKAAVLDPEKIRAMDLARVFDRARLEPVFASLTDGILAENLPGGRSSLADIQLTAETVPALQKAVQTLPTAEEAEKLLKEAGAPVSNAEIGLPNDAEFIEKSLAYAPYVRNRLTLLKVLSACMD